MFDTLHEAKDEGLLDDTEVDVLIRILELKIKRLWHSPTSIEPSEGATPLAPAEPAIEDGNDEELLRTDHHGRDHGQDP